MSDDDVRVIRKRKQPDVITAAAAPSATALLNGPREQVCLTPEWLYGLLDARFGPFDHDPAPHPRPPSYDGLDPATPWGKLNYVNPPFVDLEKWIARAVRELDSHNNESVLLVPIRQQLRAWHNTLAGRFAIYPVLGYVRFRGYVDELPHVLVAVWISKQVMPESHYRHAVGIVRPIDMLREAKRAAAASGEAQLKGRITHDEACAEYPGAFMEGNTILFRGPVRAFNVVEDGKLSERRRKKHTVKPE